MHIYIYIVYIYIRTGSNLEHWYIYIYISVFQYIYIYIYLSVPNYCQSVSPMQTTLEEDRELFKNFSSILCLWFEIQGSRTDNCFGWVLNSVYIYIYISNGLCLSTLPQRVLSHFVITKWLPPWRKGRISCLWIKSVFDCLTIGIIHETMVVHMTWVWTFFNNYIYIYIYSTMLQ